MAGIAKTVGILCISVVAMGILYDLGSFKATEKALKFVISLYIIATVFDSLKTTKLEFDMEFESENPIYYQNSEVLKKEIISQTEKELTELIKKRMAEKNISYNSVSLHILEQNGSLAVDRIHIECTIHDKTSVMECIKDLTNEDTEIVIGE